MSLELEEFDEPLPNEDIFQDEIQLRRDISKLTKKLAKFREEQEKDIRKLLKHQERALQNNVEFYEGRIEILKEQVRELFEKNLELHEVSKLFIKGLEHLKQDYRIVTVCHPYHLRDKDDLVKKVEELTKPVQFGQDLKRRIVEVITTRTNSHGQASEVVIVTEHTERIQKK